LFYENYSEFAATMRAIDTTPTLQAALGRNGRLFFERNYAWPVIEKKYVDMLQQLSKETVSRTMEPMPGWFARRRRSQQPADEIVKNLPAGAYRETRAASAPSAAAGSQRAAPSHQPPAAGSQRAAQPAAPQSRPQPRAEQSGRRDQNARGGRPQGQRPQHSNPRPDNRERKPEEPKADSRQPKADGPPRADGQQRQNAGGRDQRRGRPHRRGRRPGGGGGGSR
jgi:hypothetical protein